MNEQQRATATSDGYIVERVIVERVIVERVEPAAAKGAQVLYGVRIGIRPDDAGVDLMPEPPSGQERERALREARRLLQRRKKRAGMTDDHQMLTQALINVAREIDALP